MPVVCMLPAPLSWTITLSWVIFRVRCRLTALRVEPHATPMMALESTSGPMVRAACMATRSSVSASFSVSTTGTTCTSTLYSARIMLASSGPVSSGLRIWICTSPDSRAEESSRETVDRDVRSSRAMASMVRSCR